MTEPAAEIFDLEAARTARDTGVDLVSENTYENWKATVDLIIGAFAASGYIFTADDVRQVAAGPGYEIGEPHHPNAWGARFITAARQDLIYPIATKHSKRPPGHARKLTT
jgi:hypothetical protein